MFYAGNALAYPGVRYLTPSGSCRTLMYKAVMNMLITHDGNFQDFPDFTNQLAGLKLVLQCKEERIN